MDIGAAAAGKPAEQKYERLYSELLYQNVLSELFSLSSALSRVGQMAKRSSQKRREVNHVEDFDPYIVLPA
ncbi:hypothetical protein NDN08_007524 [Rhodosorus marinus]|uniref:Uncharacterized protein n=1 Tax=Rhodosorus marinus TaxID=101924 RepID=A0AAV8V1D8_9RHOD|nr:hypothetical protein NDN08_007524 [Rhodosorus marinus]